MASIRRATPSDACRLAEIEVFDYRQHFYPLFKTDRYFFSELNVPVLMKEYQDEPERIERTYVYEDNGVVKGFVRVNGEEIEKLFVETAFQRMGIGGALLEHAIRNTPFTTAPVRIPHAATAKNNHPDGWLFFGGA